ncbi:MAG: hypothetical protein K9L59_14725 [Desulfobacterales bacterium]|nr:hypothetical protein [Desulfobacterales bacterium]
MSFPENRIHENIRTNAILTVFLQTADRSVVYLTAAMESFLIILGAFALAAGLICLQLAAMRRRHPNAELLTEALKMIADKNLREKS